jgi:hypothetical protein
MNGTLALLIALVSYGNLYLKRDTRLPKLDFKNSSLVFCNTLEFNNISNGSSKKTTVANSPEQWFDFLKKDGCKDLKIYYQHSDESKLKDFESAGFFGGGGEWIIEAVYENYANYWVGTEDITKPEAKDKRIWSIRFSILKKKAPILNLSISTQQAKINLAESLTKIIAFASMNINDYWTNIFKDAYSNLDNRQPSAKYYKDFFINKSYSLGSRQLLTSANITYAFGGMGSWKDIAYADDDDEKLGTDLTADLYNRVNEAIIVALNNN